MSLNVQKTVYLTFSIYIDKLPNYHSKNNFKLKIGNTEIQNVTSCKYLGVVIDQHLRWDIH